MTIEKYDELNLQDKLNLISEVNSYNGYLEEFNYYENDEEFFTLFFSGKEYELARAINYGDYNFMDAYVKIDVYGNLISMSAYELEKELDNYADEIIDTYNEYLEEGDL